ncbi:MAG: hypothetical protein NC311_15300 [Muribaculaceae bacterium]|nr:hypothetical protein [Muribaculaceae bacterium]
MKNEQIFTVTITGAENEVREYASDCVFVLAHNASEDANGALGFNMSLNMSANRGTTLMLLEAMDQAKQQILDSDPKLRNMYNQVQLYKAKHGGGDGNA